MGRTYKAVGPNPDHNHIPAGRMVRESNARRFFKAVNVDNVTHALGLGRPLPLVAVTLPVGISFFTFMAISYVVDIYRGVLRPARGIDVTLQEVKEALALLFDEGLVSMGGGGGGGEVVTRR